ncbi:MAG: asparagine synthase (glutamine-hydrolyzing) [Planctomycetes bacterium]|nr:asparagine synthase (glutamine-hydrolyzing) [Planctomycetota bacterium]
MCGIAGILNLSPEATIERDALRTMAAQLVHRGPDDEGVFVDQRGRCGLAFRRLAIIDIAGGHQPLCNEDGTVWVVFNGEIYNFRELRAELEHEGHQFKSQCDSEVIVHLYESHGEQCFERLDGMFAIAIWDAARGRLLLARDPLGKKPLVYATFDDRFYFASEAKAILALPGIPRRIDPQSLHRYLLFQYVPAPHSIYLGFQKLPPGHCLSVDAGSPSVEALRAYWRVPHPAAARDQRRDQTPKQAQERLGELLTRAVEKRLIADVPLGAFLSGGIDSSIVVGLMRKLGVSPLRTFSIGFADARYDETAYARLVAKHFQTEHHEYTVTPQAREILDTLAWHYDEPFADSSAIPTYYVSKWTRESVTVALTGDAGDECFAGYDRYRAAQLAARFEWLPRGVRRLSARAATLIPHGRAKSASNRVVRFVSALPKRASRRYLSWVNVFTPEMLAAGYRPDFAQRIQSDEPLIWFDGLHDAAPGSAADRAVYTDFNSYLPYDLLTKVDIASMACGLECRSPFLDRELVEYALARPPAGRGGRDVGKRFLREWAADFLPPAILTRPKMGFGVPVGEWFRGTLQDLVRSRLTADDALSVRMFRRDWLTGLIDDHVSGRANHEHRLWALLMLELWRQRWDPQVW